MALWCHQTSRQQYSRCVQPPYAENRTYGGVGGCRGEIPGTRPDQGRRDPNRRGGPYHASLAWAKPIGCLQDRIAFDMGAAAAS